MDRTTRVQISSVTPFHFTSTQRKEAGIHSPWTQMARTIVNAQGVMKTSIPTRKEELRDAFRQMEEQLRLTEKIFTKSELRAHYHLSTNEATAFLKLMEEKETLASRGKALHPGTGWREEAWLIVEAPKIRPGVRQIPQPRHLPRRMMGSHECDRCGSRIPGTGRHNKSSRGHTKAICDLAMVRMIMNI